MQEHRLLKLEDIIGEPLFKSAKKDVMLYGVVREGRAVDINGYVSSESHKGFFYAVSAKYEPGSKNILYGVCDCEAYKYFGNPCKHILRLRNVFSKNEDKFGVKTE